MLVGKGISIIGGVLGLALIVALVLFFKSPPNNPFSERGPQYFASLDCNGKYKDGSKPSVQEITQILRSHSEWLQVYTTRQLRGSKEAIDDSRRANLCGADLTAIRSGVLSGVDLTGANLQVANFIKVNLAGTILEEANISGASFHGAFMNNVTLKHAYGLCVIMHENKGWITKLQCTNFHRASLIDADMRALLDGANLSNIAARGTKFGMMEAVKLDEANLLNADLSGLRLSRVDLSHSILESADLSHTNLIQVDFTDAKLHKVNLDEAVLQGVTFSLAHFQPHSIVDTVLIGSKGLSTITFLDPKNIVKLRNQFKDFGLRNEQKALTAALRKFAIQSDTSYEQLLQAYVFGGWITDYGAQPLRSIIGLIVLIPVFSLLYCIFLLNDSPSNNIWKVWPIDSIKRERSLPIRATEDLGVIQTAVYFSLLSAFHIGWRDLNVGSWITRLQFKEYTIRATGWIRFISGVQSLISVYLLALWLLTYFGTPFE